ncbi:MAG: transcription elongation factor Spt5 [Candidatus Bilamarchaeaceae archaeon]
MIYTIRVTTDQEKIVSEILLKKARAEKLPIFSILFVESIKGYLFIEAFDENTVIKLIQKTKHVKGIIRKPVKVEEIQNLITASKTQKLNIENGDIVEMVSGPFKGEKARVTKIDETKDELTVELLEVAVPIPVTIKTKMIKIFQKAEDAAETYRQ